MTDAAKLEICSKTAVISDNGLHRYRLGRRWGSGEIMAWLMLNPSTADADVDDPTIRRCMSFARREGYDGIEVLNVFSLRSPNPRDLVDSLQAGINPEGAENERHWGDVLQDHNVGMVVAAWGAHIGDGGMPHSRTLLKWWPRGWFCLGLTNGGYPRHPLYVRGDTEMLPFLRGIK